MIETPIKVFWNAKLYCMFFIKHPERRDSGNDFSFPVPFPFLKLNDNDKKSFLFGYPKK